MRKILLVLATVAVLSVGALAGTAQADHGRYYGGWGGHGGHRHCHPAHRGGYYYGAYRPSYYGGYRGAYGHPGYRYGGPRSGLSIVIGF